MTAYLISPGNGRPDFDHCAESRDRQLRFARRVILMAQEIRMPKTLTEIRSLARSHTRCAINVLVGVMRSKDATAAARVLAANAILDRGWGKTV